MTSQDFFDVLSISDENGNVDMIQALMGNDCLGTYFNNGIAKLYFYSGLKNNLEARLQEINSNHSFQWKWEKQNKENWPLTWQENFQPSPNYFVTVHVDTSSCTVESGNLVSIKPLSVSF